MYANNKIAWLSVLQENIDNVQQNYIYLNIINRVYAEIAAERYSTEVLQTVLQEYADLPQPLQPDMVVIEDIFILARRNNFRE